MPKYKKHLAKVEMDFRAHAKPIQNEEVSGLKGKLQKLFMDLNDIKHTQSKMKTFVGSNPATKKAKSAASASAGSAGAS